MLELLKPLAHSVLGMFVGLVIRLSPESPIRDSVTFDYQFFFNLLLPPIILASGYELHQVCFCFCFFFFFFFSPCKGVCKGVFFTNLSSSYRRISSAISALSSPLPLPELSYPLSFWGWCYIFGLVFRWMA